MASHALVSPRARVAGALLLIVGAWGALVPFIGPTFGYTMGSAHAWAWTESHATLHFAPGAATMIGALFLLGGRGVSQRLGAGLAAVAGTWFLIGPALHPIWAGSGMGMMGMMSGSATSNALSDIGYHYGTGAAIALLAGYAWGALGNAAGRHTPRDLPLADTSGQSANEPRVLSDAAR